MRPANDIHEPLSAEALVRDLERLRGTRCADCRAIPCSHEVLMSIALGFKDAARCLECLSTALQRAHEPLLASLRSYIQQRDCYRHAWEWASRAEETGAHPAPSCILARFRGSVTAVPAEALPRPSTSASLPLPSHAEWDAGDMACGDLVLELRLRMHSLKPGEVLRLLARDPGAPEDLPAWCRLTGHTLLHAEHPAYWIKRKE